MDVSLCHRLATGRRCPACQTPYATYGISTAFQSAGLLMSNTNDTNNSNTTYAGKMLTLGYRSPHTRRQQCIRAIHMAQTVRATLPHLGQLQLQRQRYSYTHIYLLIGLACTPIHTIQHSCRQSRTPTSTAYAYLRTSLVTIVARRYLVVPATVNLPASAYSQTRSAQERAGCGLHANMQLHPSAACLTAEYMFRSPCPTPNTY